MTVKEQIINKSIARIEKRLEEINNTHPILELIKVREEAQKLLDDNPTTKQRTSPDFIAKIEILSKKERRYRMLIKASTGEKAMKLMDEELRLTLSIRPVFSMGFIHCYP